MHVIGHRAFETQRHRPVTLRIDRGGCLVDDNMGPLVRQLDPARELARSEEPGVNGILGRAPR